MLQNFLQTLVAFMVRRTVLCLIILFCLGVGIALSNMSNLSQNLLMSQAIISSRVQANYIIGTWQYYSQTITNRLGDADKIEIRHDYFLDSNSIPPPATFILDLASNLDEREGESRVNLYSDYPYPWRKNRTVDPFSQQALEYLRLNRQKDIFYQIMTDEQGSQWWKYAQSVVMKPNCVACHNTDPNSPKKDWGVGDIRGVVTIAQPLDELNKAARQGIQRASLMLGGFGLMGMVAIALVISRINTHTKTLENRVQERTAILAQTNTELEQKNQLLKQVFGRYLSDEVVANLLSSPDSLHLGGDRRKVTILTSDLRGFTTISEQLSAEEVISILNIYLEMMADVISTYQGTISEIMGDGILVLFGAPYERDDDADRAIACGLAMQLAMKKVNRKLTKLGFPKLEMGIGINCGLVVLGNIGSKKRAKYGVVGNQVNLAFRIESYSVGGEVLISETLLEETQSLLNITEEKQVNLKGIKDKMTLYSVTGIQGEYQLFLPSIKEIFQAVVPPMAIRYCSLDDTRKSVQDLGYNCGQVVKRSPQSLIIQVTNQFNGSLPEIFSNLKIDSADADSPTEFYAKVTAVDVEMGQFTVRLTAGRLPLELGS